MKHNINLLDSVACNKCAGKEQLFGLEDRGRACAALWRFSENFPDLACNFPCFWGYYILLLCLVADLCIFRSINGWYIVDFLCQSCIGERGCRIKVCVSLVRINTCNGCLRVRFTKVHQFIWVHIAMHLGNADALRNL